MDKKVERIISLYNRVVEGEILVKADEASIESVLDRFPTAEVIEHDETGWTITAEVYGDGVDIWLRGQGDNIEVLR